MFVIWLRSLVFLIGIVFVILNLLMVGFKAAKKEESACGLAILMAVIWFIVILAVYLD